MQNIVKTRRQRDIIQRKRGSEQRRNLRGLKPSNAAANGRHIEMKLRVLRRKAEKILHIGLHRFHATLHRGDSITLPLQAHTLPPHRAKLLPRQARRTPTVHPSPIANTNLSLPPL